MAPGGEAVGRRDDGMIVFVPGGAPGDRALVALEQTKKGHARGRLVSILSPGESRLAPICPLAMPDACGGCPLMPVQRATQLVAKEDWVRRAVRPSRLKLDVRVSPILSPAPELAYRLRARLVVRDGKIGFAGAKSHRGVAISRCFVLAPALDRVLFQNCAQLVPIFGEGATVRGLLGRHDGRDAVQIAVEPSPRAARKAIATALAKLVADGIVVGALLQGGSKIDVFGAPTLELGAESEYGPFFGAADGFAQPSAAGHAILPRLVAEAVAEVAPPDAHVVEVFSGGGNLSRAIRRVAGSLICIEGDARASARAQLRFGDDKAVTLIAQPAQPALQKLVRDRARCDVVVLDPPRSGAADELGLLTQLGARRVVYVSCDPMTLGRDLATLHSLGYAANRVQPIDLMPHTAHVECVAIADKI